jgi:hypothetical protein
MPAGFSWMTIPQAAGRSDDLDSLAPIDLLQQQHREEKIRSFHQRCLFDIVREDECADIAPDQAFPQPGEERRI